MEVTGKCEITGKYGFDSENSNRFTILEVEAGNGDIIKVNKVNGIRYNEIWQATEQPRHEEKPIIDNRNKIIVVGGQEKQSKRTICIIGK